LFCVVDENDQLEEKLAQKIFHQLIEAIQYLQMKGISHRDIKLENIMCTSNFQIKLIDFGFATSDTSLLFSFYGSPHYCSPEVINFIPYSGKAADIWSCGVVLFAILHGYLPFDEETLSQTKKFIKKCKYSISSTLSNAASDLIKSLLEKDPNKRISAKEILEHEWFQDNLSNANSNEFFDVHDVRLIQNN
jgi:serine/threonine protein kinase